MSVPWVTWSPFQARFVKRRTDVAVVCFVKGEYYEKSAEILVQTFAKHSPDINVILFKDYKEIGSPSQEEVPYAFKYYAIQKVRSMGYSTVLWCDSVLKLQKPLNPVINQIPEYGVYLQQDGWKTGQFANDRCLDYFGVTRDEAMEIPAIWACFMGFDFSNPITHEFMRRWKEAMDAGVFHGNHRNTERTESQDPRCLGHRHDQSCAELISHQMKIPRAPIRVSVKPNKEPEIYFSGRGF